MLEMGMCEKDKQMQEMQLEFQALTESLILGMQLKKKAHFNNMKLILMGIGCK